MKKARARRPASHGRAEAPRIVAADAAAGRVVVRVDAAIYPLDAVYGAAYEMIDRAWVFLARFDQGVAVELRRKAPGASAADLEALAGELGERLLDHALRVSLARQYGPMRELIVARALQGAGGTEAPDAGGPTANATGAPVANPPAANATGAPAERPAAAAERPADDPYDVAGEWAASRERPPGRRG